MNSQLTPNSYRQSKAYCNEMEQRAARIRQASELEASDKRTKPSIVKVISQIVMLTK